MDEVGEDDDSIIEPDLPELEKFVSWPKETAEGQAGEEKAEQTSPPPPSVEVQEKPAEMPQEKLEVGDPAEPAVTVKPEPAVSASSPEPQTQQCPQHPPAPEPAPATLGDAPTEELNAKLEEARLEDKVTSDEPSGDSPQNHAAVAEETAAAAEPGLVAETVKIEVQHRGDGLNRGVTTGAALALLTVWICLPQSPRSPFHVWGRRKPPASTASLWVKTPRPQCRHVSPSWIKPKTSF